MKIGNVLLILLTILCVSSCGSRTKYRPKINGHDYINQEIIEPITYRRVHTGDKEFNQYVSIKLQDLKKIALILKKAWLPRHVLIIVKDYEKKVKKLEKEQAE